MKLKKVLSTLLCVFFFVSMGGCSPMNDCMKAIKNKDGVFAIMETTRGFIALELYYKDTPLTVTNFVGLSEGTLDAAKGKPFYDGLKFHRVIADFMIQGGDPKGNGTGGPGYKFADECMDKYQFTGPGILAMANAGAGTNGSQFFITHVETPWLNGKHTIFGNVVYGQDVVNAVQQGDLIKKVTIVRQGKDAEAFTATQADFNKLNGQVAEKAKKAAEEARKEVLSTIQKNFPNAKANDQGIFFEITKEGTGSKVGTGKNVAVHYKGYLINGQVFDSSEGREPLEFTTAARQMITGFDLMVQDMRLGEKRTMVLPPEMAYGSQGAGGVIPGNAYIAFDVELTKIK